MNLPTLIVLALVVLAAGLAVRSLRRQKQSGGCTGCCGSCQSGHCQK